MSRFYRIFLFLFSIYFYQAAQGQNPVQFRFSQEATSGNEVLIKIKASMVVNFIDNPWCRYYPKDLAGQ